MLHRLKHQLPIKILKMIYNSLILSRLHYGNIIWGGQPASLIKLNKKALRAIANVGCNVHTNPIEKRLKLLSVPDIHQLKLFCLYKKLTDQKLPNYIAKMFENMSLDTDPNFPKSVKYRNTIRFALPTFLQTAPSVLLIKSQSISYCYFKFKVKEHILERYSSLCTVVGCRSCHLRMHIS